jgi:hypothetical protein
MSMKNWFRNSDGTVDRVRVSANAREVISAYADSVRQGRMGIESLVGYAEANGMSRDELYANYSFGADAREHLDSVSQGAFKWDVSRGAAASYAKLLDQRLDVMTEMREIKKPEIITVTAEQIHAEVYAANDTLAADLIFRRDMLLAQRDKDHDEMLGLRSMGFVAIPDVALAATREKDIIAIDEELACVQHYQAVYPQYKFIRTKALLEIVQKYGLGLGWPAIFVGNIPAKNRKEMLGFKFLDGDEDTYGRKHAFFKNRYYEGPYGQRHLMGRDPAASSDFAIAATLDQFKGDVKLGEDGQLSTYHVQYDPIVLRAVKYGWLVITAWGPEAEAVVNENRN